MQHHRRALFVGLTALLLGCTQARAADLIDLYQQAQQQDPSFRAAYSNYLAELQKLPEARARLWPNISAQASYGRNHDNTSTDIAGAPFPPAGTVTYSTDGYSIKLVQPLYNRAILTGLGEAHAVVARAAIDYAQAQQDLILRVAQAYFGVLAAQDNLTLAQAEKTAISQQLQTAEGRLQVGLGTITEVNDAKARYEIAAANEIVASNRLADSREALREVTGAVPQALKPLAEQIPLAPPAPADMQYWVKKALEDNLGLISQRRAAAIAKEEIKRQSAGHYPTLSLVGSRTDYHQSASIPVVIAGLPPLGPGYTNTSDSISLQLSVPIFQGGEISDLTREAEHRYDAALESLEARRRAVERAARADYLDVASSTDRVGALKQAVVAGESALEAKVQGFAAGLNTNLEVLDAQRDLYRAKRDYSQARYDYVLSLLRLEQVAGVLDEKDLEQVDHWLQ